MFYYPGVPGGSAVSRVTIEVDVVGLNPTRDSYYSLQIDRMSVRELELAKFAIKTKARTGGRDGKTPVSAACPEGR